LVDEMAGHVTYVGEKRKAQGVGGGHEGQKPAVRPTGGLGV